MSTSVIGLPLAGHVGVPLTSSVLVRISGKSFPSLPLWVRLNVSLDVVEGAIELGRCDSCLIDVLVLVGLGCSIDIERSVCLVCDLAPGLVRCISGREALVVVHRFHSRWFGRAFRLF